jgi:hypothetical protein
MRVGDNLMQYISFTHLYICVTHVILVFSIQIWWAVDGQWLQTYSSECLAAVKPEKETTYLNLVTSIFGIRLREIYHPHRLLSARKWVCALQEYDVIGAVNEFILILHSYCTVRGGFGSARSRTRDRESVGKGNTICWPVSHYEPLSMIPELRRTC